MRREVVRGRERREGRREKGGYVTNIGLWAIFYLLNIDNGGVCVCRIHPYQSIPNICKTRRND